jgi:GH35 family endo-1,4-beta-xylanase
MRLLAKTLAVATVSVVAATSTAVAAPPTLPTPTGKYGAKVDASLFGMQVHYLTNPSINTTQKFGSIRIWDNNVRWDQINPSPGVYNWEALDTVVANAEAVGAKEIIYVLGGTPLWAAKYPSPAVTSYFGPGVNSVPANDSDWTTWVKTVAQRYKGRITAYQPWNEANLSAMFYAGDQDTAVAMADLTKSAAAAVKSVDPSAKFTTASSTVIQTKNYVKKGWLARYMSALKQRKVKPDTLSIHLYPWLKKGPGNGNLKDREVGLRMAQQVFANNGYKKLPIWDTEMNYGNTRDTYFNKWPKKKYNQPTGAAMIAQTYLYSLSNGVTQVYWYGWDDYGLGVWTTSKSGQILQPGEAYNNVSRWLTGAKNGGCTPIGSISTCTVKRGATKQFIVFRSSKASKTYSVPSAWKVKQACTVLDSCKPIRNGKVKVGLSPLLLTK